MKIEYNFYKSGLTRLDELVPGHLFINGGLMNQPDLFLVLYPPRIKGAANGCGSANTDPLVRE